MAGGSAGRTNGVEVGWDPDDPGPEGGRGDRYIRPDDFLAPGVPDPVEKPRAQVKAPAERPASSPPDVVTAYEVRDAQGALVAVHERHQRGTEKRFLWRRPDGRVGLGGVHVQELPLFGSESAATWPEHSLVVVTEGEKAALAVRAAGLNALGTVSGASAGPGRTPLEILRGFHVTLWPDNDPIGRSHMERILSYLGGVAASVRWVDWPGAPQHGDAADATSDQVQELVDAALPRELTELRLPPSVAPKITFKPEEIDTAIRMTDDATIRLERLGPTYRAMVDPLGAEFIFREVRTDREMRADVTVRLRLGPGEPTHLFRSTSTLSLTGRNQIAKTAAELAKERGADAGLAWKRATFAAVEAVIDAEERIGVGEDLRTVSIETAGPLWVFRKFWPAGPAMLVMPASAGKSTFGRALIISQASGRTIIPGIVPDFMGPVLLIPGEDPQSIWHARSVEAICRGAGLERRSIENAMTIHRTHGQPLARIIRQIAERAADCATVHIDSYNATAGSSEYGQVQDRDRRYWDAIEEIERPTFVYAHPNREDAKRWNKTGGDGRAAGTDILVQRTRIAWRGRWKDEKAVAGSSFRRYTFDCVKPPNNFAKIDPIGFAAAWTFGRTDQDPGVVNFTETEPFAILSDRDDRPKHPTDGMTPAMRATYDAWDGGAATESAIATRLDISVKTANQRLHRLKLWLANHSEDDPDE